MELPSNGDKYRSQIDRINVVLDIVKQLKNYPTQNMGPVDLYKDEYVYVQKLKKIFSDYIKQPQDDLKQFKVDTDLPSVENRSDRWVTEDTNNFYYDIRENDTTT